MSGGGDEGIGDTPAGYQPIDPLRERLEHPELGRYLRPADDRDEGARRLRKSLSERFQLGDEQRTGAGDRGEAGDAVGRGLGAVRGTERIHHVHVAQCRHPPRQRLVVGLLAFEEAHVLAEHDLAVLYIEPVQPVLGQSDLAPEQLAEPARHRREGESGIGRPFSRPSEV